MAIKSAAQLAAENTADFPDNTIGSITPAILRAFNQDMIDTAVGVMSAQVAATVVVDFSVAGDTPIPIVLPAWATRFRINSVEINGASGSLAAATAGLFTLAAGAGVAIVTAASAITVSTGSANTNNNAQGMTINNGATQCYDIATVPTLFFKVVGTAAQTGKVTLAYFPLP